MTGILVPGSNNSKDLKINMVVICFFITIYQDISVRIRKYCYPVFFYLITTMASYYCTEAENYRLLLK